MKNIIKILEKNQNLFLNVMFAETEWFIFIGTSDWRNGLSLSLLIRYGKVVRVTKKIQRQKKIDDLIFIVFFFFFFCHLFHFI